MAKIFNDQARQRIVNAVRKVERLDVARSQKRQVISTPQTTFFLLNSDIEHGSFGDGILAGGPSMDSVGLGYTPVDGATAQEIYNPGPKVWSGSTVLCERASIAEADIGNATRWTIQQAWSATRIAGIATTDITAGGNGTLSSVSGVDGPYPYNTALITLATSAVSATAGQKVWADLVHTPTGSEWYGFHVDTTTSSTPGGGSRQLLSLEWTSGTPALTNIDWNVPSDYEASAHRVSWANAAVSGSSASMTFNNTNNSITFAPGGDYMVYGEFAVDSEVIVSPGETYQTPHAWQGVPHLGGVRVFLERFNAGTGNWSQFMGAAYAFPGPLNFHQTATMWHRFQIASNADPIELRWNANHMASTAQQNDAPATFRIFWARWHSEKL